MEILATDKAPGAIGPYSQAVKSGSFLFTSGSLPVDVATGEVPVGVVLQTRQACINIGHVLESGGASFKDVVKTTCFLSDMADFAEFNKVYAEFFISKPARSTFAVKALPLGVLVEIETIAELK